jgi:hypothetical protein
LSWFGGDCDDVVNARKMPSKNVGVDRGQERHVMGSCEKWSVDPAGGAVNLLGRAKRQGWREASSEVQPPVIINGAAPQQGACDRADKRQHHRFGDDEELNGDRLFL